MICDDFLAALEMMIIKLKYVLAPFLLFCFVWGRATLSMYALINGNSFWRSPLKKIQEMSLHLLKKKLDIFSRNADISLKILILIH